jgi:hypothetical protein
MKKLMFLFAMLIGFGAFAQPYAVPAVTPDYTISKPFYGSIFGQAGDLVTNSATKSYVFRVTGDNVMTFHFHTYIDWASGTVTTGKTVISGSFDGVRYIPTDSISESTVTADLDSKNVIKITGYMYPYMKVQYVQAGTATATPKIFVYAKKN